LLCENRTNVVILSLDGSQVFTFPKDYLKKDYLKTDKIFPILHPFCWGKDNHEWIELTVDQAKKRYSEVWIHDVENPTTIKKVPFSSALPAPNWYSTFSLAPNGHLVFLRVGFYEISEPRINPPPLPNVILYGIKTIDIDISRSPARIREVVFRIPKRY